LFLRKEKSFLNIISWESLRLTNWISQKIWWRKEKLLFNILLLHVSRFFPDACQVHHVIFYRSFLQSVYYLEMHNQMSKQKNCLFLKDDKLINELDRMQVIYLFHTQIIHQHVEVILHKTTWTNFNYRRIFSLIKKRNETY
jgi:hypothetical protein